MHAANVMRLQLNEAMDVLHDVVREIEPAQYNWQPGGTGNPVSKLHAHTLTSVDFWVNVMALRTQPLWPEIAEKTGLPVQAHTIWQSTEPILLDDMQAYAARLRTETLPHIDALGDGELARELDTPYFGRRDVGFTLRLASAQLSLHTGEISAIKGLQGLKGLPF